MSDIFISYARSTADQAQAVAKALRGLGYDVWRDDELPAHRSYAEVIEERLQAAKVVVVIWSAEAMKSEWVQSEADTARTERKLVQLTVDGSKLPRPFDRIQCADLVGWTGDLDAPGWRKVAASVADLIGGIVPSPTPGPAVRKLSVCVLPFANISDDPQQEYFSDGISEDIITDLSKVSALEVCARNTAFTFKGKSMKVPDVARELGVSHVLEGSVRKAGARVRITAQLIDGATGNHIWAERYDRDLTDIFALQDEISEAIVGALKLKLLPEEKKAIVSRGTENAEAYNLYLMAREQLIAGTRGDPRREEAIVRFCRRAVELDPRYARAWAMMADAQSALVFERGRAGDNGLAAAERALSLDAGLAEAHAVRGNIWLRHGRIEDAADEIALALRLDPESYEVNMIAGNQAYGGRRFEDAIRHFGNSAAASEADYASAGMMASASLAIGDEDGARRAASTSLERIEKALAHDRNNGQAMAWGAIVLGILGERDRAKEWMDRAMLMDPDNMLMRYNFACALSLHFVDADAALELLDPVMAADPGRRLAGARTDPDLDPIRDDPRFKAMLAAAEARLAAAKPENGAAL
jgi:adenylate cyclase